MALMTDNAMTNDKTSGPTDPTDGGVLHNQNKVDNHSNKDEAVEESPMGPAKMQQRLLLFCKSWNRASQWEPPRWLCTLSDEVLQEIQQIEEQQKKSVEETAQLELKRQLRMLKRQRKK